MALMPLLNVWSMPSLSLIGCVLLGLGNAVTWKCHQYATGGTQCSCRLLEPRVFTRRQWTESRTSWGQLCCWWHDLSWKSDSCFTAVEWTAHVYSSSLSSLWHWTQLATATRSCCCSWYFLLCWFLVCILVALLLFWCMLGVCQLKLRSASSSLGHPLLIPDKNLLGLVEQFFMAHMSFLPSIHQYQSAERDKFTNPNQWRGFILWPQPDFWCCSLHTASTLYFSSSVC